MNKLTLSAAFVLMLLLFGCSPLGRIAKTSTEADLAYTNKQFTEAHEKYQSLLKLYKSGKQLVPDSIYTKATDAAIRVGRFKEAEAAATLLFARHNSDANYAWKLADVYERINQPENEYKFLTRYENEFAKIGKGDTLYTRMYNVALSLDLIDDALKHYPKIQNPDDEYMRDHLKLMLKSAKPAEILTFCNTTLKKHPSFEPALEWKANHYYNKAEDNYQRAMAAYEKNKTNKQYNILLGELKPISADFRTARDILVKLRTIDPKNTKYISMLRNCYARLDMPEEVKKMDRLLR
jgi:lipopolysaccharide biosynthesis regulator YciM